LHGKIINSGFFTWHWIHHEIHIPNNLVATVVHHFVRHQSIEEIGMLSR
jgi:hypothetical protein